MINVFANGFCILHQGDTLTHTCAVPDVCKTPTPAGPIPIPYINVAMDANLTSGATKTNIANTPIANAGSKISVSNGDNAGVVGGVVSGVFMGQMAWGSFSFDVKVENKGVVRFLDVTLHNGSTPNCAFISAGSAGFAMGSTSTCPNCGGSASSHTIVETKVSKNNVGEVFFALEARYKEQQPLLIEHRNKRLERVEALRHYEALLRQKEADLVDAEKAVEEARLILEGPSTNGENRAARESAKEDAQAAVTALEEEMEGLEQERQEKLDEIDQALSDLNSEIEGKENVLAFDTGSQTYTRGYMVGVAMCRCGESPKLAAACSGEATPGFSAAVGETDFTLVESFYQSPDEQEAQGSMDRSSWSCAAPKLLGEAGGSGHKVKAASERWYDPFSESGTVIVFERTVWSEPEEEGGESEPESETSEATFAHGDTVPPCESCGQIFPTALCDQEEECTA